MEQVVSNLCKPSSDEDGVRLRAKSHQRLITTANLLLYYETVGRETTTTNIKWSEVGKSLRRLSNDGFHTQEWKGVAYFFDCGGHGGAETW